MDLAVLWDTLNALEPLRENERQSLIPLLRERRLAVGDDFVRASDTTSTVGFLVSGVLRYFYVGGAKEYTRYFCQGRSFVSSQQALLTGEASTYTIRALTECQLLTFSFGDWQALVAQSPKWARIHQKVVENALILAERRERSLVLDDAATRYRRFLEEYPGLEPLVRQYDVASYLGITPVTLSRLRSLPASELT